MAEKDTDTASLEVLRRLVGQGETKTKPKPKVEDAPLVLTNPTMDDTSFAKVPPNEDDADAKPVTKKQVNMRVDPDIIAFFKEEGPGHLTRMHAVLRDHVDAECKKRK
ncbi:BrnA antitoxin family protein [Gymnodinialimonas ulvae]|uniref:BrnA antitoxin family protein n=1 Tax=Gymnodinialimonas ulvae TaxID=3126504 RepID=UPI0030B311B6